MNAEQFHDALSHLPPDLIAETDALRSAPRARVIPWKKWAGLVACLVLVFSSALVFTRQILPAMGGASKNSAPECAPQEPAAQYHAEKSEAAAAPQLQDSLSRGEAMEEAATDIAASGAVDTSAAEVVLTLPVADSARCIDSRQTAVLHSPSELAEYLRVWADFYHLYPLEEACTDFDESWFETQDLLLIRLDTEKSEHVPTLNAITFTDSENCQVTVSYAVFPEDNSPDPACWHILLPVEKGYLPEETEIEICLE